MRPYLRLAFAIVLVPGFSFAAPVPYISAVTNGFGQNGPNPALCPGEAIAIYGTNLGTTPSVEIGPSSSTTITVDGESESTYNVSQTILQSQLPTDVPFGKTVSIIVIVNGTASAPFSITLSAAAPVVPVQSGNMGAFVLPSYQDVAANNPAPAGSTVITELTGIGPLDADGNPTSPVEVVIGPNNEQVTPSFSRIGPFAAFPGSTNMTLIIPNDIPAGNQPVTVIITVDGVAFRSNTVTLPVVNLCQVNSADLDQSNANGVISASDTGGGCSWTITLTNLQSYLWLDFTITPIGNVAVQSADTVSALYTQFGIFPPGGAVVVHATFSEPAEAVSLFANLTGGALDHAMLVNLFQGVIDGLKGPYGNVEWTIEQGVAILQAFDQMPHLSKAFQDVSRRLCLHGICVIAPDVVDAGSQISAFEASTTEPEVLSSLLQQLAISSLENSLTSLLKTPGAFASVLEEVFSNVRTALVGNVAGSVQLSAR